MHPDIPKLETQTPDLALERQALLRELFPEAWSETGLNFDKLRELLGDLEDERSQRYLFSWAGKREALQLLQAPSHATLHPAPGESLDWDETKNLFIEGDNLEALKLLYKPLFNRVKMIYIDPPYNTGNDFIYPDNFADPLKNYLIQTGQKDANGDLQTSSPDTSGHVHSRWLSMMYPRLFLARQLLKDDGVIFVSIDDNEVHHLRLLMNEVFGEENFVANVVWQKKYSPQNDAKYFSESHEHVLCYTRSKEKFVIGMLARTEEADARYKNPDNDPRGPWKSSDLTRAEYRSRDDYDIISPKTGKTFRPPKGNSWGRPKDVVESLIEDDRISFGSDGNSIPSLKRFLSEVKQGMTPQTIWFRDEVGDTQDGKKQIKDLFSDVSIFDTPKPVRLIQKMMRVADVRSDQDDIVLDFFSGSGTTAQAVLELNREDGGNRRFVLVQLPEKTGNPQFPTIADIGKERIRRVVARMKAAQNGTLDVSTRETPEDLGFKVWKLGESNFRQLQPTEPGNTKAYLEQLELLNDALLPGSDPQSVLAEVALREGLGLNARLEPHSVADVWRVRDEERDLAFWVCLSDSIELELLTPLALKADDVFICRGIALDDTTAANLALQCHLKMI